MKINITFGKVTNVQKFAQFLNIVFNAVDAEHGGDRLDTNGIYHHGEAAVFEGSYIIDEISDRSDAVSGRKTPDAKNAISKINPTSIYLCIHRSVVKSRGKKGAMAMCVNAITEIQKKYENTIVFSDINPEQAIFYSHRDGWGDYYEGYMFIEIEY